MPGNIAQRLHSLSAVLFTSNHGDEGVFLVCGQLCYVWTVSPALLLHAPSHSCDHSNAPNGDHPSQDITLLPWLFPWGAPFMIGLLQGLVDWYSGCDEV